MMALLSRSEIRTLYDRIAPIYDWALMGYRIVGVNAQRQAMVRSAGIRHGDTVLDLGCGSGANFPFLVEAVGPSGRVVGADISGQMLARARRLCDVNGWTNVETVQTDMADAVGRFAFDAAVAAFALEMVPDYDGLVAKISHRLPAGGRLASLGLKHPDRWPGWLVTLAVAVNKPFGVSRDYADVRPWRAMESHLADLEFDELWWGAGYRCAGREKTSPRLEESR